MRWVPASGSGPMSLMTSPVRVLRGISHRDDAAHRGAYQDERVEPEPGSELGQIARLIGVAVGAGRGPGTLAVTADIEREDAIAILEMPGERVERVRTPGVAVDADDRRGRGLAPFEVMQGKIVHPQRLAQGLHRDRHRQPPSPSLAGREIASSLRSSQ